MQDKPTRLVIAEPVQRDHWYLRIEDGTIYGPSPLHELQSWAEQGRIAARHELSRDRKSWTLAYKVPELMLDCLVLFPDGELIGPFHYTTAEEMLAEGSIQENDIFVRYYENERNVTAAQFTQSDQARRKAEAECDRLQSGTKKQEAELKEKIRTLQEALQEAKEAYEESEARYAFGQKQLGDAINGSQRLKQNLDELKKAHGKEQHDLQTRIANQTALKAEHNALKKTLRALKENDARRDEAIATAKAHEEALTKERDTLKAGQDKLKQELAGIKERNAGLKKALSEAKAREEALTKDQNERKTAHDQKDAEEKKKLAKLEKELADVRQLATDESAGLRKQLKERNQIIETLRLDSETEKARHTTSNPSDVEEGELLSPQDGAEPTAPPPPQGNSDKLSALEARVRDELQRWRAATDKRPPFDKNRT